MRHLRAAFRHSAQVDAAVQALLDVGFPSDEIRVPELPAGRPRTVPVAWQTLVSRWALRGAMAGASLGTAAALTLTLPLNPQAVAQILGGMLSDQPGTAMLQGAFLVGIALAVLGGFWGASIWHAAAEAHADAQHVWVGLETNQGDLQRAAQVLRATGAIDLETD